MSLLLIRHGEAASDQLTSAGWEQCRLLARRWVEQGVRFDQVFVGPRNRHRQTHECAAAEFRRAGLAWPDPIETKGLDEYPGFTVVSRVHPEPPENYVDVYRLVVRRWVAGEIAFPDLESWPQFRRRVQDFIQPLIGSPTSIAAFTSAGAVAASLGFVHGLNDIETLELSFTIRNATERIV